MTDGFIGNEADILAAIHERVGAARIFSFGVGSSTNRYLLERMAVMGRGAAAFIGLDARFADAVDAFYRRVAHPALADVAIDWGELGVTDVYPRRLPDLFVGRPVVVTGRFTGNAPTTIQVTGRAGRRTERLALRVDPRAHDTVEALPSVWARMKIADLEDEETWATTSDPARKVAGLALEYGLASAYTAFVAVDSSAGVAGTHGTTVFQAVPVPAGVPYETTVQDPTETGGSR
jgi:Ca-activated chloride channel homolog